MSQGFSPAQQYSYFRNGVLFNQWVREQGYRVVGFRDPQVGDWFIKWEANPTQRIAPYLKLQSPGYEWIPGDPLAIVEKI